MAVESAASKETVTDPPPPPTDTLVRGNSLPASGLSVSRIIPELGDSILRTALSMAFSRT